MRVEWQIIAAFILDQLLGDPCGMPHPVKLIGRLSEAMERSTRKWIGNQYAAGILTVLIVLTATGLVTSAVLTTACELHPWIGNAASVLILYTTIAARDLSVHSTAVYESLEKRDLKEARTRVQMLVGRDTADLDETRVTTACVESVAENLVDGVTSPLFFAAVGGPVGAMLYRAVNTMDSMFGYKNERYVKFGRAAARIDDVANLVPARISSILLVVSAALLRFNAPGALRILLRDRLNHSSPNSGHTEAAMAGALGIRLGGRSYYFGEPVDKPLLGDPLIPVIPAHILMANRLMLLTACLATVLFLSIRLLFTNTGY